MKKYIRTKDNELYKYVTDFDEYIIATKDGIYSESIKKDNILDQTDTIEELCDEFVLFYEEAGSSYIPWATYERRGIWEKERENIIKEIVSHPSYRQPVLYGAIWVDKGLFYVSKMSDKGELELL